MLKKFNLPQNDQRVSLLCYVRLQGFIFDSKTMDWELVEVENFPVSGESWLSANVVFVGKLNRIYLIGGQSWEDGYLDSIWFIQL